MNKTTKIILVIVVVVLFIWLPAFPVSVVPETTIRVVDENNQPLSNVEVKQDWQHWSFESESHTDQNVTNLDGFAAFSEKTIKISGLNYLFGKLGELASGTIAIHSSSGPFSNFIAKKESGNKTYWGNTFTCYGSCKEDAPKEIVIKGDLK